MEHAVRPFCKHAGGKTSLLATLLEHVPDDIGTYYEPFVGGGALFFALKNEGRIKTVVLNDTNERLIATFKALKSDAKRVITKLRRMKNDEEYFRKAKKRFNVVTDLFETAALYIFLNKTCFNGLYRVNQKNEFNVPFGWYKNPTICDAENLQAVGMALKNTRLTSRDFQHADLMGKRGDFVYFDPPYLKRVGNEFVGYGTDHFGFGDHVRLRDHALVLKKRGVRVLISNSGADPVRKLYASKDFKVFEVKGARSVGAHASTRGTMPDLLIKC